VRPVTCVVYSVSVKSSTYRCSRWRGCLANRVFTPKQFDQLRTHPTSAGQRVGWRGMPQSVINEGARAVTAIKLFRWYFRRRFTLTYLVIKIDLRRRERGIVLNDTAHVQECRGCIVLEQRSDNVTHRIHGRRKARVEREVTTCEQLIRFVLCCFGCDNMSMSTDRSSTAIQLC
jgi:hypothetical protein